MAVVSSGNYIYLVGDNFTVFNVSNPTNASIVGTAALPMAFSFYNRALVISGGYAYVGYWSGATIYTLGVQSPPPLAITTTTTNTVLVSWPTPTLAFALQENADLQTTNWVTLTNTSIVVSLKNQVTIPASPSVMFYRLMSQ